MDIHKFKTVLRVCIAEELDSWKPESIHEVFASFDLGVHPWYGYFELSFLTIREVKEFGQDFKYQIADWKYYNFNQFQDNVHKPIYQLGQWMENYARKEEAKNGELFFETCAEVLNDVYALEKLKQFNLSPDFDWTVYHPDDPEFRNYCFSN